MYLIFSAYIIYALVGGFYLLGFPFDDFFFGIPVCDVITFLRD